MVPVKRAELDDLVSRLADGDEEACTRLQLLGDRAAPAVPALCGLLGSGSRDARLFAIAVLERVGAAADGAVPALGEVLRKNDAQVRAAAADALGAIGGAAVGELSEALGHRDAGVRRAACVALGTIGPAARSTAPRLVPLLDDADDAVRDRALEALGRVGAQEALDLLLQRLVEADGAPALAIIEVLSDLGVRGDQVTGPLRRRLHDPDPDLVLAASRALLALRRHQDAVAWALVSLLAHADKDVRLEALVTLAEGGRNCRSALPALQEARVDDDEEIRAQATIALAKVRPEYAPNA